MCSVSVIVTKDEKDLGNRKLEVAGRNASKQSSSTGLGCRGRAVCLRAIPVKRIVKASS